MSRPVNGVFLIAGLGAWLILPLAAIDFEPGKCVLHCDTPNEARPGRSERPERIRMEPPSADYIRGQRNNAKRDAYRAKLRARIMKELIFTMNIDTSEVTVSQQRRLFAAGSAFFGLGAAASGVELSIPRRERTLPSSIASENLARAASILKLAFSGRDGARTAEDVKYLTDQAGLAMMGAELEVRVEPPRRKLSAKKLDELGIVVTELVAKVDEIDRLLVERQGQEQRLPPLETVVALAPAAPEQRLVPERQTADVEKGFADYEESFTREQAMRAEVEKLRQKVSIIIEDW